MGLAKNRFDFESSAKQHHFELKGQPISDKISLKEAKFTNGSKLKLLKGQQKSKTVEHETRDLGLDEPLVTIFKSLCFIYFFNILDFHFDSLSFGQSL